MNIRVGDLMKYTGACQELLTTETVSRLSANSLTLVAKTNNTWVVFIGDSIDISSVITTFSTLSDHAIETNSFSQLVTSNFYHGDSSNDGLYNWLRINTVICSQLFERDDGIKLPPTKRMWAMSPNE